MTHHEALMAYERALAAQMMSDDDPAKSQIATATTAALIGAVVATIPDVDPLTVLMIASKSAGESARALAAAATIVDHPEFARVANVASRDCDSAFEAVRRAAVDRTSASVRKASEAALRASGSARTATILAPPTFKSAAVSLEASTALVDELFRRAVFDA